MFRGRHVENVPHDSCVLKTAGISWKLDCPIIEPPISDN